MFTFVLVIHIIISVILIFFVLLQTGKGAELGAAFGGMGQETVASPETALHKLIMYTAVLFIITSIILMYLSQQGVSSSVLDSANIQEAEESLQTNEPGQTQPAPVTLPETAPTANTPSSDN